MKRLLILFFALIALFTAPGAEVQLLQQLPDTAAGALCFNVKKLVQSENFSKWAKNSFFAGQKETPDGGVETLLVFTTSKPNLINAMLVKLYRPLDLAKNLVQYGQSFTTGELAGKRAYFIQNTALGKEQVIVQLDPQLFLLTLKRSDAQTLLQAKKGAPKLVTDQVAKLELKDVPIWYVDTGVRLPVQQSNDKKDKVRGNIRMCLDPFCNDNAGKFRSTIECPDASSASQMAVLVPMITGVVSGIIFSEDSDLNNRFLSQINPRLQGNDFCMDAEIPAALMRDINAYFTKRNIAQMIQSALDLSNL